MSGYLNLTHAWSAKWITPIIPVLSSSIYILLNVSHYHISGEITRGSPAEEEALIPQALDTDIVVVGPKTSWPQ